MSNNNLKPPPKHPWSGNERSETDVVNYSGSPKVPIIILIILFVVIIFAIICILLKLIRNLYDKHAKSDSYKFVDEESKQSKQLTFSVNDKPSRKNAPLLSSILLMGDRKSNDRLGDHNESENASFTVEANVHDSSNETNGTNETSLMNHDDVDDGEASHSYSHTPIPNCSYNSRSSTTATESDV